jgi:ABC-type multidrug transport system fused ATPase/permease subunit
MATSKTSFQWLASQIKPFIHLHVGGLFCIVISSVMTLLDPLIIKWLIDDILLQRKLKLVPIAAIAFGMTFIGRVLSGSLSGLFHFLAIQKMSHRIRLNLFRQLQHLSADFHERTPVGESMHRLEQNVDQVGELGGEIIPMLLRLVIMTVLVIITMFALNAYLTCVILPIIPAFLLIRYLYRSRLQQSSKVVQERSGMRNSFLQEQLSSMLQIQLLSRELSESRKYLRLNGEVVKALVKRKVTEIVFSTLSISIVVISIAITLGVGGYQVLLGSLSIGGLVAFYSYVIQLFNPLSGAIEISSRLHRVYASAESILHIANLETSVKDNSNAVQIRCNKPLDIEFKDVVFSYRPGVTALNRINFYIKPGEKVALVGPSGSGKSTIAKLIVRLYDVSGGAVVVGGMDIRDVKLRSLRSAVSLVPQEPVLFDATLRQNLIYGTSINPSDTELGDIALLTRLDQVVQRFSRGWNENIGTRGCKLSGGERQRLALARALLQHPQVLILDESTSALDAPNEKHILDGLDAFMQERANIIISHRLSALRLVDRIIVLNQGENIGEGTHSQLYRMNSTYRHLYDEQFVKEEREFTEARVL